MDMLQVFVFVWGVKCSCVSSTALSKSRLWLFCALLKYPRLSFIMSSFIPCATDHRLLSIKLKNRDRDFTLMCHYPSRKFWSSDEYIFLLFANNRCRRGVDYSYSYWKVNCFTSQANANTCKLFSQKIRMKVSAWVSQWVPVFYVSRITHDC